MPDFAVPSTGDAPVPHETLQVRRRPFGLIVIIILLTLQVLLGLVVVTLSLISVIVQSAAELAAVFIQQPQALIATILIPVWALIVVVGLWRYRLWAWYMMMILLAYWMATSAVLFFRGTPQYVAMLLNVGMVFYLNQREVRSLFSRQAEGPSTA